MRTLKQTSTQEYAQTCQAGVVICAGLHPLPWKAEVPVVGAAGLLHCFDQD